MCCYGQLVTNLMQLDLSVFVLNLFSSVQSFSSVGLFATPWTAACQASLSITNSQSLLKLMSIDLVMPSTHLILPSSSSPAFNLSSGSFPRSQFFPSGRQIVGISASASIFPVNIQDWFFFFFRMNWFDLLAVQRTLKSLLQHYSSKGIYVCHLSVTSY